MAESSEHQPEEWDSDDEDELDDEEMDRRVKAEMLKRAWAAWNVAEETLHEDPEAFGGHELWNRCSGNHVRAH